MTEQTVWMIGAAALAGLLAGWLLGRAGGGSKERHLAQLEEELKAERARMHEFRHQVDAHFDRTASLFASIAGSYKELFEHLSSGYDKLTTTPTRDRLRERVGGLLAQSVPHPAGRQPAPASVPAPVPPPGVRQASSDTPPPLATRLTMREGAPPPVATPAPVSASVPEPRASTPPPVPPVRQTIDPAVTTGLIRDALEGRTPPRPSPAAAARHTAAPRVEPTERRAPTASAARTPVAPTIMPAPAATPTPTPKSAAPRPAPSPAGARETPRPAPAPTVSLRR